MMQPVRLQACEYMLLTPFATLMMMSNKQSAGRTVLPSDAPGGGGGLAHVAFLWT